MLRVMKPGFEMLFCYIFGSRKLLHSLSLRLSICKMEKKKAFVWGKNEQRLAWGGGEWEQIGQTL